MLDNEYMVFNFCILVLEKGYIEKAWLPSRALMWYLVQVLPSSAKSCRG
jgi:hypothetical protein